MYDDETDGKAHDMPELDDIMDLDLFLNSEVLLPHNGEYIISANVIGRINDCEGNPVGTYNINPIVDTQVYNVMFPERVIQKYSETCIVENLYGQVDNEGRRYICMDDIVDHCKDSTVVTKE